MLHINSLAVRNFLSIGNVEQRIDLSIDGLTLVLGENADVGGANSRNGCGKTSILQAISYGLFGKPLTRIRLDNLVNAINGKDMLVILEFEVNGKKFRIERGRKPNVLRFYKDGVAIKDHDEAQGENRHTQTDIEHTLGMTAVMFKHLVALNTSTMPFLREEAAVQREVIEELLGITLLSQRAEALKKLIDVTKERLRNAEAVVKANGDANARVEQAIDRATAEAKTWRVAHDKRVAELQQQVEGLRSIDIDYEISIFDRIDQWRERKREADGRRQTTQEKITLLSAEITRLREDVVRYETEVRSAADREQEQVRRTIERLRSEVTRRQHESASKSAEANQLAAELSDITTQLANPNAHRCQTCGQGLAGTDHLAKVIANLTHQESALTEKIGRLLTEQETANVAAKAIEAEIAQMNDHHQEDAVLDNDTTKRWQILIHQKMQEREILQQQEDEAIEPMPVSAYKSRDAVWQLRQQRDLLLTQLKNESERPNPHDVKIDGLRATLVALDYTEVNEFTDRFKHEQFLYKLLTAKDSFVRKKMIDQGLNYLNKRLDHYLQRLGLPHEVAFQADLSVEIELLGISLDFEQLSRGEMNRVILATSWAFRDVWENLNTKLNLLWIDEFFDTGLDGAGVEAALDVLIAMADQRRSIFLITHREELRHRIDTVLMVRKENQFTSFC